MKQVKNEEETSEGASNDAVVELLGRSVGEHARVRASDSAIPEQKKYPGEKRLNKKLRLSGAWGEFV